MNDPYKHIRAYRVEWLQLLLDWCILLPILQINRLRTTTSLSLRYLTQRKAIEQDIRRGAVFMTNHRDIVLDSAYLSLLLRMRYNLRPYIGIGNNLFGRWWIEPLVRSCRCFIVIRNGTPKELLAHSKTMSAYINDLRRKGKSIWIAQREGRSKDGNDVTQPAVLKMLTIGADKSVLDAVKALNICPVSISYQQDPCDYLKAIEALCKRNDPNWKKTKEDDVFSMKTGINDPKGKVVFCMTPSINHWIAAHEEHLQTLNKNDLLETIAAQIDQQIYAGYSIEPLDAAYLEGQVRKAGDYCAKKGLPFDEEFIRNYIVAFYDNISTKGQSKLKVEN